MRYLIVIAVVALVAHAQDKPSKLGTKAKEHMDASSDMWAKFTADPDKLTDDDLRGMADNYDAAIDLLHKITEAGDSPSANANILRLARRSARLRATLWAREMRKKAEAFEKAKANRAPGGAVPVKPRNPVPPAAGDGASDAPVPSAESAPAKNAPQPIRIFETKSERRGSINRARRFVFDYFRFMKPGVLRRRCERCRGSGVRSYRVGEPPNVTYERRTCSTCGGIHHRLRHESARRSVWITRTPMARSDPTFRQWYSEWLAHYDHDARSLIPIKRLAIKSVAYHGLWAVVEWEETRGKKKERITRTLVRMGRVWFFYYPATDAVLLGLTPGASPSAAKQE